MNVGFIEARAFAEFDCFIFHDVDMLPEDDRNFYVCSAQPRHVGSHINKWNYQFVGAILGHFYSCDNFGKSRPVFIICSLFNSERISR